MLLRAQTIPLAVILRKQERRRETFTLHNIVPLVLSHLFFSFHINQGENYILGKLKITLKNKSIV